MAEEKEKQEESFNNMPAKTKKQINAEIVAKAKLIYKGDDIDLGVLGKLVTSCMEQIPPEDRISAVSYMLFEIAVMNTNNVYEALGIIEDTKHDLLIMINNVD